MDRLRRWLLILVSMLPVASDAVAQSGPTDPPGFKDWRIVNRFRLFNPWFGIPPGEKLTLMNAGVNTDHFLDEQPDPDDANNRTEQGKKAKKATTALGNKFCDPSEESGSKLEMAFYSCLYGLSHGQQPAECRGLNHGNYHELFNWNPLTNAYEAPPGLAYPKRDSPGSMQYKPEIVDGDWIVAVELKAPMTGGPSCSVEVHYGDGRWEAASISECLGQHVRFTVPLTQVVAERGGPQRWRILAPGVAGKQCPHWIVARGRQCVSDEWIGVRVASGGKLIAQDRINPADELLVTIGDSFGSGEGNPDLAGLLDRRSMEARFVVDPVWLDRRCNRSMHAAPARAAMCMAAEQRGKDDKPKQRSVSFLSFACSGAKITDGLLNRYDGVVGAAEVAEYLVAQAHFGTTMLGDEPRKKRLEGLQARYLMAADRNLLSKSGIPAPFPDSFYHRLPSQLNALNDAFCSNPEFSKETIDSQMLRTCGPSGKPEDKFPYRRSDLNLVVSIGGNDIGFAQLIKDFVMSRSSDIAATDSWPAMIHDGMHRIREDYAKGAHQRKTIGLAQKLDNDIGYLGPLFRELNGKIRNRKLGFGQRHSGGGMSNSDTDDLGLIDIFLVGYPSPNRDENEVHCHNQDFVGMPPFGQVWHISESESKFAETRVVEPLGAKLRELADRNQYVYVDPGGVVNGDKRSEKFRRRGWCALGLDKPASVSEIDRCPDNSHAHDSTWKPYCARQRWFRTLGDATYTQGPLPFTLDISSGAMHPTFEAHRHIGERLFEEILNLPPSFHPLGSEDFLKSAKESCSKIATGSSTEASEKDIEQIRNCENSKWIMAGGFKVAASDMHSLNMENTTCKLEGALSEVDCSPRELFSKGSPDRIERAEWSFAVKDGPLTEDGHFRIWLEAEDSDGKRSSRHYTAMVDGNPPVAKGELVPVSAGDSAPDEWKRSGTIRATATDGRKIGEKPAGKAVCSGSGVESIRIYLSADDSMPGTHSCVLQPTVDPDSCSYSATLTFPEPEDKKKCKINAITRAWVQAVDVAGWIGERIEIKLQSKIDLVDPVVACKLVERLPAINQACPTEEFTRVVGQELEICAKDDGGSGVEPAGGVLTGITDPGPVEGCRVVRLTKEGSFDIRLVATDKSGRSTSQAWKVRVEAAPLNAEASDVKSTPVPTAAEPLVPSATGSDRQ